MKINKIFLIFLCFCLPLFVKAQRGYQQYTPHSIGVSLPSFMNIYNSYTSIEYNICLTDRFYINTSAGIILNHDAWSLQRQNSPYPNIGKHNMCGFRLALEPQFLISSGAYSDNFAYIGLETYFSHYKYISERLKDDINGHQGSERYNVENNTLAINAIIGGMTLPEKDPILMTVSFGLGARFSHVKNDLGKPINSLGTSYRLSDFIEPEENGWHIRPSFTINCKVMYRF